MLQQQGKKPDDYVSCPKCQHENLPDAKFCVNCGGKLGAKT